MHVDQSPEVAIAILGKHKKPAADVPAEGEGGSVDPALETHMTDFLAAKANPAKAARALQAFYDRCCVLREQEEAPASARSYPSMDDDDEDD